jgi:Niemann-Pick C1 protein
MSVIITDEKCKTCVMDKDNITSRPSPDSFEQYLPFFLEDNPTETCAKGGHAAYSHVSNFNIS